jgi:hypothetical protein
LVADRQAQVREYVQEIQAVDATLDPANGSCATRRRRFDRLQRRLQKQPDEVFQHMSQVMASFAEGLFAGGAKGDLPRDNLDLERWFRLPKGHERHIHGHSHAGVRIVQEGPTLVLALDAHRHHPGPFTPQDLAPYRNAVVPECQQQAIHRRKVMRKARSKKSRPILLDELETRYQAS